MRLPRLPVSRRRVDELAELVCAYNRIASEDLAEYKRRARKAEARVAELEQAIREHRDRHRGNQWLWSVLDGHDRQERDTEAESHSPWPWQAQHPRGFTLPVDGIPPPAREDDDSPNRIPPRRRNPKGGRR